MKKESLEYSTLTTNSVILHCGLNCFKKEEYLSFLSSLKKQDLDDKIKTNSFGTYIIGEYGALRKDLSFLSSLIHAYKYYNDLNYKKISIIGPKLKK